MYQPSGVLRFKVNWLILSVTDPNVWPGSMTGTVLWMPTSRCGCSTFSISFYAFSPISGLGLRSAERYVVRGCVLRSASNE